MIRREGVDVVMDREWAGGGSRMVLQSVELAIDEAEVEEGARQEHDKQQADPRVPALDT